MVKPSRRGPMVEHLASTYQVGERHACRVLCVARATYRYRSHLDPRTELRMRIREIAQSRVRYGYPKAIDTSSSPRMRRKRGITNGEWNW